MDEGNGQETFFNVGQWKADQREKMREEERAAARKLLKDYVEPTMEVVRLEELRIDERYQRTLSMAKVHEIRANFSPNACQPLAVSHRKTGDRYVVDGQHRAKVLEDIGLHEWVALVYRNLTMKDEAAMWEEVNERRTKPQPIYRFRTASIRRDSETVSIIGIATGAGFKINFDRQGKGKDAGTRILAVTTLQKIYRRYKGPGLADVLNFIPKAWKDPDDSQRISGPLMLATAIFLGGKWKQPCDLDRAAAAIGSLGPETWLAKVRGGGISGAEKLAEKFLEKYKAHAKTTRGKH